MPIIVTQTADNASHIQDAFRRLDRDGYPLGVYEAIFDYINDTHGEDEPYHLDVIAWCSDLSETTIDRSANEDDLYTFDDLDDRDSLSNLDDLAEYLRSATPVLYVDREAETIYHLAYHS